MARSGATGTTVAELQPATDRFRRRMPAPAAPIVRKLSHPAYGVVCTKPITRLKVLISNTISIRNAAVGSSKDLGQEGLPPKPVRQMRLDRCRCLARQPEQRRIGLPSSRHQSEAALTGFITKMRASLASVVPISPGTPRSLPRSNDRRKQAVLNARGLPRGNHGSAKRGR